MQNLLTLGTERPASPVKGDSAMLRLASSNVRKRGKAEAGLLDREEQFMKTVVRPDLQALPMLPHETLYVGVDIGKKSHVAGFISPTLLTRYQRFEVCPALSFENSREGFRCLIDQIKKYVPLIQV